MRETVPLAEDYVNDAVPRLIDFTNWLLSSYATNIITANDFNVCRKSVGAYTKQLIEIAKEFQRQEDILYNL